MLSLTGGGPVAELDVSVAVRGGLGRVRGVTAGRDEVVAMGDVVLVVGHTLDDIIGAVLLRTVSLSRQTGTHQLEAVIAIIRGVQTLSHSLYTSLGTFVVVVIIFFIIFLLNMEANIEHVTAGGFISQVETFVHVTGTCTVLLFLFIVVTFPTLMEVTVTILANPVC